MDENLQPAESVQQPTSTSTGEELYNQYASGESIESINDSINSSPNSELDNENNTTPEPDNNNPAEGEQTNEVKPFRTYASQDEFQKDVDKMIGKRLYDTRNESEKFKAQVAEFLGVSKDEVEKHLIQLKYEREAEINGVSDPELYAQNKILEQKLNEVNNNEQQKAFLDNIDRQVDSLKNVYPSFDMEKCVENAAFCRALKNFNDDPDTARNAVELAYKAVFFEDVAKDIAKKETDKILASIKAGTARVYEGAVNTNMPTNQSIDPSKLTDKQFDDIIARVKNGEKIILG